jgi:NTE family protein
MYRIFKRTTVALLLTSALLSTASAVTLPALAAEDAPAVTSERQTAKNGKRQKKLVLVLGGGGTRGAAHIGVLRVLSQNNIKIDAIVGTSIGAIIGGMHCAGLSPDELETVALNKSFLNSYLTVPIPVRVLAIPVFFIPHLFGYHPYDGLYRGNRFRNYINGLVPDNQIIEDLPIKFGAVCCDLVTAKPYVVRKGNIGLAIQASSAIPALRRPVPFDMDNPCESKKVKDGQPGMALLVDGGPQANLPVKQGREIAKELGTRDEVVVVAVNVDEKFQDADSKSFRKIGSVSKRIINMFLAAVDEGQLPEADLVIHPESHNMPLISTKKRDVQRSIRVGEEAGRAALPQLSAILY